MMLELPRMGSAPACTRRKFAETRALLARKSRLSAIEMAQDLLFLVLCSDAGRAQNHIRIGDRFNVCWLGEEICHGKACSSPHDLCIHSGVWLDRCECAAESRRSDDAAASSATNNTGS